MASSKEYRDYILEQLCGLDTVTYRPMMGEFLLYYNGMLFGGIYDDRFLVKKTETNKNFEMSEAIPYENAKAMYQVDNVDNRELLEEIVMTTYKGLVIQ